MTTPGQDGYFFTPAPPAVTAAPPTAPTRLGYAPAAQSTLPPSAPVRASKSLGWLLGAGFAALALIAIVVGFVVLAHKDKHTEGNTVLRPIQQAGNVQLESDLRSASTAEESYFAEHGAYTTDLAAAGFRSNSAQVNVVSAGASDYCLKATNTSAGAPVYASHANGISPTPCG